MNTYKGRTFCDVSHRCANQECPKILPYIEKKHVESTGLTVAYHPFKTKFCGYVAVNYEKLENRHRAIMVSLFMRSLITDCGSLHPSVIALQEKLRYAEGNYYRKHPNMYKNVVDVSKIAYDRVLIAHDNTHIDYFYLLLHLFEDNRGTFIGNFKVKESLFIKIYRHFGSKTTFELEQNALKVYKSLTDFGEEELKNAHYCIF